MDILRKHPKCNYVCLGNIVLFVVWSIMLLLFGLEGHVLNFQMSGNKQTRIKLSFGTKCGSWKKLPHLDS